MRFALFAIGALSAVSCSSSMTAPTARATSAGAGVTIQGARSFEPSFYAATLEAVSAATSLASTADSDFRWSADAGLFRGDGPRVTLIAPPIARSVAVRVATSGTTAGSAEAMLHVHDELREIGGMSRLFLERFSRSAVPAETVVDDFQAGCGANGTGKQDELDQTRRNRKNYEILPGWIVGLPDVEVEFSGISPFRKRRADAWAAINVAWTSRCLVRDDALGCPYAGYVGQVAGVDWVTARYDTAADRWWLCDSDFDGRTTTFTSRAGVPLAPWRK